MVENVFENWQQATQTIVQAQQEMFREWLGLWTHMSFLPSAPGEEVQTFQEQWNQKIADLVDKPRQLLETQLRAGLQQIEAMFRQAAAPNSEEFRAKTLELWRKSFDSLRQIGETQLRDFQAAVQKWNEVLTKNKAA
jgi:hypothetical protein